MLLSGESSTEIWELPLKTVDLETRLERLLSLTGKTDRGGQRREECLLSPAQQPKQLNDFLKVTKETCIQVGNSTQIFVCLVHCLSSWMLLPASLVIGIGIVKCGFLHCLRKRWKQEMWHKLVINEKKNLSLPSLLLLHQLRIQGNILQFRFSQLATQKIPQEFPLQICFLLSSTSFLVHMFHICLGACVRASSSPAYSPLWRSLENWVFFVRWSIMVRLCAPRDLILCRKRSRSMWKASGKLPAALRNAILPSSDDENGCVWASETKSFLANLHWNSKWKKSSCFLLTLE